MASTSEQQRQQAIARDDFPSKFRPTFPKKRYSSQSWSIVSLIRLGLPHQVPQRQAQLPDSRAPRR
ncbi:hypothetical protein [Microcoleus sp. F4-D5]|uniref:hypothetical protein n=1 Tax=Microcoleus sp. F4-D5 TaxID=2818760 RepID=UPI002FD13E9D